MAEAMFSEHVPKKNGNLFVSKRRKFGIKSEK
jgi:hypothetical protein